MYCLVDIDFTVGQVRLHMGWLCLLFESSNIHISMHFLFAFFVCSNVHREVLYFGRVEQSWMVGLVFCCVYRSEFLFEGFAWRVCLGVFA